MSHLQYLLLRSQVTDLHRDASMATVIPELRTALILVQASLILSKEASERCWSTHFQTVPHQGKGKGLTAIGQGYSITPLGLFGEEIVEVVSKLVYGVVDGAFVAVVGNNASIIEREGDDVHIWFI